MNRIKSIAQKDIYVQAERLCTGTETSESKYCLAYYGNYVTCDISAEDAREIIAAYSMRLMLMRKEDKMKNKEQEQKITDISIHIASFSASFKPAPDARHATHWFTTDEVYDAIRRIDPGAHISKEQVHQAMLDAGYKYQNRPGSSGLDFRWMLQAKN